MSCTLCWRPKSGHNPGCPLVGGNQSEYDRGNAIGFGGVVLVWYQLIHYSQTFQLGYRAGRAALEEIVDVAAEARFYDC